MYRSWLYCPNTCTNMFICCIYSSITSVNSHQNSPPQHPTLTHPHTRPCNTLYQTPPSKAIPYQLLPPTLPDGNKVGGEDDVTNKVDQQTTFVLLHRPLNTHARTHAHMHEYISKRENCSQSATCPPLHAHLGLHLGLQLGLHMVGQCVILVSEANISLGERVCAGSE